MQPPAEPDPAGPHVPTRVARTPVDAGTTTRANRRFWDSWAEEYQAEHASDLGRDRFVWGPEGLQEDDAHLLGDLADLVGRPVVEVGAGAAQCSRWLVARGVRAVGVDLSATQLAVSTRLDQQTSTRVPVVVADAQSLPLADGVAAAAFSAYGALPFVADADRVFTEVARVLAPGGRWVVAVPHPVRWCLPDDPGPDGLVVRDSYFDRRAYVERDDAGDPVYVEHHRTVGDWVRLLVEAGFVLDDVVEPEWPEDLERTWGGWSPLRGRLVPGTAIFVTHLTR
ncbi:MAG: class I SAM-dependent methyltransferase [Actinomycetes bacterium]